MTSPKNSVPEYYIEKQLSPVHTVKLSCCFSIGVIDLQYRVSVRCTIKCISYTYIQFFRFFSHLGHDRISNRVLCAMQEILTSYVFMASLVARIVRNLPAMWETGIQSLDLKIP